MKLLRIMRHVDLLEGRFASACGCAQPGQRAAATELTRELAKLEATVAPNAPGAAPRSARALPAPGGCLMSRAPASPPPWPSLRMSNQR